MEVRFVSPYPITINFRLTKHYEDDDNHAAAANINACRANRSINWRDIFDAIQRFCAMRIRRFMLMPMLTVSFQMMMDVCRVLRLLYTKWMPARRKNSSPLQSGSGFALRNTADSLWCRVWSGIYWKRHYYDGLTHGRRAKLDRAPPSTYSGGDDTRRRRYFKVNNMKYTPAFDRSNESAESSGIRPLCLWLGSVTCMPYASRLSNPSWMLLPRL